MTAAGGGVGVSLGGLGVGSLDHDLAMGVSMDLIDGIIDGDDMKGEEEEDIDYVDNLLSHSNSHQDDRYKPTNQLTIRYFHHA